MLKNIQLDSFSQIKKKKIEKFGSYGGKILKQLFSHILRLP